MGRSDYHIQEILMRSDNQGRPVTSVKHLRVLWLINWFS